MPLQSLDCRAAAEKRFCAMLQTDCARDSQRFLGGDILEPWESCTEFLPVPNAAAVTAYCQATLAGSKVLLMNIGVHCLETVLRPVPHTHTSDNNQICTTF